MNVRVVPVIALALTLGLAGCASEGKSAAERTVERFYAAVRDHDGQRACVLLAPEAAEGLRTGGESCSNTVLGLDLPGGQVRETVVWGDEAQVRLTHDTVFLHRFPLGWMIRAAGCRPRGYLPYSCEVKT
ncbi:hypothetical protein ACFQ08_22965 [Streptosporangium algeriense]|uniref:Lipoprotein n=1 Tax=Streptosporangium algeriense TaxID=1682748 RepID=A0ABW3DUA3_9ACTN